MDTDLGFSSDGSLSQVEGARAAVLMSSAVVGVCALDAVVLAVERRAHGAPSSKLLVTRSSSKIMRMNKHLAVACAGLSADARVLFEKARIECESFALAVQRAPSAEYMARYVGSIQQKYTQRAGVRPFGISMLLAGVDVALPDSMVAVAMSGGETEGCAAAAGQVTGASAASSDCSPQLWATEPSGAYAAWKAHAVGRGGPAMEAVLENYFHDAMSEDEAVRLALRALLEVLEPSAATAAGIEVAVIRQGAGAELLDVSDVDHAISELLEEEVLEASDSNGGGFVGLRAYDGGSVAGARSLDVDGLGAIKSPEVMSACNSRSVSGGFPSVVPSPPATRSSCSASPPSLDDE